MTAFIGTGCMLIMASVILSFSVFVYRDRDMGKIIRWWTIVAMGFLLFCTLYVTYKSWGY